MEKILKPFQVEGVRMMLQFLLKNKSVYNADEQGLGKTIQTIEVINQLSVREDARFLIICPKVMMYTWASECREWLKKETSIGVLDKSRSVTTENLSKYQITITSYEMARINEKEFHNATKWNLLVADESHRLKNRKAQRTKAVLGSIWRKADFKIALSGTPFRQNVVDGYTLFNAMAPEWFPTFMDFAGRYAYAVATPYAIKYTGIRNAPELKKLIRSRFYFRRTKKEVLPELPSKIFQKISLGPEFQTPTPKTEKEKLEQEIFAITQKLRNDGFTTVCTTTMAGERRIQGEIKAPAVIDFVENLLEQDLPVVVGAYHKNVIEIIKQGLIKHNPVVITGDTPAKLRSQYVKQFQEGKSKVFIGQFQAAGEGITLTASSNIVLAEPSYDPSELSQFIARCHRIGQEEILTVYYFMVDTSIDNEIVSIVMRKLAEFEQVVEN